MNKNDLSSFRIDNLFIGILKNSIAMPNNLPFPMPITKDSNPPEVNRIAEQGVKVFLKLGLRGNLDIVDENTFRYSIDLSGIIGNKKLEKTMFYKFFPFHTVFSDKSTFEIVEGTLDFNFSFDTDWDLPFDPYKDHSSTKSVVAGIVLRGLFFEKLYKPQKTGNTYKEAGWKKSSFNYIDNIWRLKSIKDYKFDPHNAIQHSESQTTSDITNQKKYNEPVLNEYQKFFLLSSIDKLSEIPDASSIIQSKSKVIEKYQTVFSHQNVPELTQEEFALFLKFENNCHWSTLQRQAPNLLENFDDLKESIMGLVNEELSIDFRFNYACSKRGVGKAIATAILQVAFPEKYGVWNGTSEKALKQIGLFPDFKSGTEEGEKYQQLNEILIQISKELGIDLWTLDTLFWVIVEKKVEIPEIPVAFETFITEQNKEETKSLKLEIPQLLQKAASGDEKPQKRPVISNQYQRNPHVVALAKKIAEGYCQLCEMEAPFVDKDGNPFLEVHHIKPLAEGGADTIKNAVALCPNCHRKMHNLAQNSDKVKLINAVKKFIDNQNN
jgi:hypothetical protein